MPGGERGGWVSITDREEAGRREVTRVHHSSRRLTLSILDHAGACALHDSHARVGCAQVNADNGATAAHRPVVSSTNERCVRTETGKGEGSHVTRTLCRRVQTVAGGRRLQRRAVPCIGGGNAPCGRCPGGAEAHSLSNLGEHDLQQTRCRRSARAFHVDVRLSGRELVRKISLGYLGPAERIGRA